jgi:cytochrome c-type biogenesis protein CcmH/NrfF
MMDEVSLWGLLTILGPIVLLGVIIWVVVNNRVSRQRHEQSERATAQLYDEQDRIDREKDTL